MGLDMYLSRRISIANYDFDEEGKKVSQAVLTALGAMNKDIYKDGTLSIELPAGYWRKVNAVHQWFVDNVQEGEDNCASYHVSAEQLTELRDLCKQVQASPESAADILPSASGFFFGGTEYDEWYHQGIADTIKIIDEALDPANMIGKYDSFYYQSSW